MVLVRVQACGGLEKGAGGKRIHDGAAGSPTMNRAHKASARFDHFCCSKPRTNAKASAMASGCNGCGIPTSAYRWTRPENYIKVAKLSSRLEHQAALLL